MTFRVSRHAEEEMVRRQIPRAFIDHMLNTPEQRLDQSDETQILQSRFTDADGKVFLVRAVLAITKDPPVLVTVYRTTKIEKYWKQEHS